MVSEKLPDLLRANKSFKAGRYWRALRETFFKMDEVLGSPAVRQAVNRRKLQRLPDFSKEEDDDAESDLEVINEVAHGLS